MAEEIVKEIVTQVANRVSSFVWIACVIMTIFGGIWYIIVSLDLEKIKSKLDKIMEDSHERNSKNNDRR